MSERLDDTAALITGASGIGAATAVELAQHGARVALVARRADRLNEIKDQITAAGPGSL